jgi:hypothetical protein
MEMAAVKQQTQPSSAAGAGPAPMLKKGTVAGSITTTATAVSLTAYPHGGAFHPYTKPLDGAPTNLQPRLSAVIPPSLNSPTIYPILMIFFFPHIPQSFLAHQAWWTLLHSFILIYQNHTFFLINLNR